MEVKDVVLRFSDPAAILTDRPKFSRDAIRALASVCPWPDQRPTVEEPPRVPGWLGEGARELLSEALSDQTRLVIELGAWVGLTTRFIADQAPHSVVIAIDHWAGSPEHFHNPEWKAMLPTLFETFLALCWDYRERVIPLRMTTLDGLRQIASHGLEPDLIYVDAEHSYEAVTGELELIHHLFPRAVVVGDDYDWKGVAPAVRDAIGRHGWTLETAGSTQRGRAWKLNAPEPTDLPEPVTTQPMTRLDTLNTTTIGTVERSSPVVPRSIDCENIRIETHDPRYLTILDLSAETGLYPVARLVDDLARRRPDIPILIVDRGDSATKLLACGIDPTAHENLHRLAVEDDPRRYWSVTRVALLPWLAPELSPAPAVEAMINGIPVVASDRGAVVDALGRSGSILPLPARLTPGTRTLPTSAEMAPWLDAIVQLWDDPVHYAEQSRLALAEADRRRTVVEGRPQIACPAAPPAGRARSVVLVPFIDRIEPECERALFALEGAGVRVVRKSGCSAIDVARGELASEALHDGAESILFIDADIAFHPADALRILARPEPVVAGVYAKKNQRELACIFADGLKNVVFGIGAPDSYLLKYASAGFLRIQAEVLRRMIVELRIPLCNTPWGRGVWPFFMPTIIPLTGGAFHYLGEDWAFSHRLRQIGITPVADTSIRLLHIGSYGFGWEEAGSEFYRYRSYNYFL
jgi:glycosyltransferase involved in cell wall biosynthesis